MATIQPRPIPLLIFACALVAGTLPFASAQAAAAPQAPPNAASAPETHTALQLPAASTGSPDEEEAAGLQYMVQEEKLAHDLYAAFYGQWGLPVFDRIAGSETAHMAAVARLLDLYAVDNPIAETGVSSFADPSLQALYDQLLAQGSASAQAALSAAVLVEETDIADLQARLASTDEQAIQRVYANLLRGSLRHRTAFSRQGGLGTPMEPSASGTGQPGVGRRGTGGRRGSP